MKCQKTQKLLSDGELSDAQQRAVEEHLEQCSGCRRYKAQLEMLAERFVSLLPAAEPRPGFAGRTVARIPIVEPQASWMDRLMEFLQPAPAALATASLALGVLLAVSMNDAAGNTQPSDTLSALFTEFFDVTPFDSLNQDAYGASEETEH